MRVDSKEPDLVRRGRGDSQGGPHCGMLLIVGGTPEIQGAGVSANSACDDPGEERVWHVGETEAGGAQRGRSEGCVMRLLRKVSGYPAKDVSREGMGTD